MAVDPDPVHPELRRVPKMPPFSFSRGNLWAIRFLSGLQPKAKPSGGLRIENISIQSQDFKYPIRLRIYRPKTVLAPAPVLVWMHGGGLIIGRPEMDDPFLFQFVKELGIVIVSIDYRLAPEHPFPTPLDDCYTALHWVHAHHQTLDIDPNRIAIGGESAGGGLAAALVQRAHDGKAIKPVFQLLIYPMLDDRSSLRSDLAHQELLTWSQDSNRFGWESYLSQKCGSDHVLPYSVPARRADLTGLPPAWIGVGTLDLFYEEDVAYAHQLQKSGVDCELVTVPGAFHGFDFFGPRLKIVDDFRKSQMAALKQHLFAP